jgi:hypothetical protein
MKKKKSKKNPKKKKHSRLFFNPKIKIKIENPFLISFGISLVHQGPNNAIGMTALQGL